MPEEPGHASEGRVTWISPELIPATSAPEEGWIVTPDTVLEAIQLKFLAEVKLIVHWVADPSITIVAAHRGRATPLVTFTRGTTQEQEKKQPREFSKVSHGILLYFTTSRRSIPDEKRFFLAGTTSVLTLRLWPVHSSPENLFICYAYYHKTKTRLYKECAYF